MQSSMPLFLKDAAMFGLWMMLVVGGLPYLDHPDQEWWVVLLCVLPLNIWCGRLSDRLGRFPTGFG